MALTCRPCTPPGCHGRGSSSRRRWRLCWRPPGSRRGCRRASTPGTASPRARSWSWNIFVKYFSKLNIFYYLTCWSTSPAPSRSCCRPAGSTSPRTPMAPANIFMWNWFKYFLRQNYFSGYIFFRFSINNQTLNYLWFVGQGRMCYINTITVNCWQSYCPKVWLYNWTVWRRVSWLSNPEVPTEGSVSILRKFCILQKCAVCHVAVRSEVIRSPNRRRTEGLCTSCDPIQGIRTIDWLLMIALVFNWLNCVNQE